MQVPVGMRNDMAPGDLASSTSLQLGGGGEPGPPADPAWIEWSVLLTVVLVLAAALRALHLRFSDHA
jgi:hypothetical protein